MIKKLLLTALCASMLFAKSNTQKAGDFLAVGIPLLAYGSTFVIDDEEGRGEFYWAYGSTMVVTNILKYTVREKRPDNNDRDSFPSGHTSSAFSGATFVHKRYGLSYALPLYVGAVYTAYSRVHVNRHHPRDVVAGAVIGIASSWYFTTPNEKFHIEPVVDGKYKGVQVNYRF
jgi:hypothetical protein